MAAAPRISCCPRVEDETCCSRVLHRGKGVSVQKLREEGKEGER
jgi:hypothetical protein